MESSFSSVSVAQFLRLFQALSPFFFQFQKIALKLAFLLTELLQLQNQAENYNIPNKRHGRRTLIYWQTSRA